jgi:hypothetical protein
MNALWFYDVILLYSDHQHVSATHVTIYLVVSLRIPIDHCANYTITQIYES